MVIKQLISRSAWTFFASQVHLFPSRVRDFSHITMTITYSDKFWKLLFRWKGSLWKACWIELTIFCVLYGIISAVYRCALDDNERQVFENVVKMFNGYSNATPITFVLGFYVTSVVTVSKYFSVDLRILELFFFKFNWTAMVVTIWKYFLARWCNATGKICATGQTWSK